MDRWFRKTTPEAVTDPEIEHLAASADSQRILSQPCVQPVQPVWDLKELLERLEGDEEFLRELLITFRSDYRACLHKAHRAMVEANLPELSRAAHTLKGMLRNLSMKSAAQTAAELEKSAHDAAERESAELLLILEGDLARVLPEVEAQLAGVKA